MDFLYDFRQARLDRYEDAGIRYYEDHHEAATAPRRQPAPRVKQILAAITHLLGRR